MKMKIKVKSIVNDLDNMDFRIGLFIASTDHVLVK